MTMLVQLHFPVSVLDDSGHSTTLDVLMSLPSVGDHIEIDGSVYIVKYMTHSLEAEEVPDSRGPSRLICRAPRAIMRRP